MLGISASLVLYRSHENEFRECIESFQKSVPNGLLIVVDNSETPITSSLFQKTGVQYLHSCHNVGFGAAHNLALRKIGQSSKYHLILNPDTTFKPNVIPLLIEFLDSDESAVAAAPKIVYPDGRYQGLCKLLPTPMDLIIRRFIPVRRLQAWMSQRYQLKGLSHDQSIEIPNLSGCFLVARTAALQTIGGFDERFFMYLEDVDLIRRLADHGRTIYFPSVEVIHGYARGSYKSFRLLSYHVVSAIKYFNKWGWFIDKKRNELNLSTIKNIGISAATQRSNKI